MRLLGYPVYVADIFVNDCMQFFLLALFETHSNQALLCMSAVAGAALELSTILAPHAFLPLACSANLAKNLAAVAASSTRAPIYRTFALQNNLADITAKGESVANLADILGTLAGELSTTSAALPVLVSMWLVATHSHCPFCYGQGDSFHALL
jgi:hypothetical protein